MYENTISPLTKIDVDMYLVLLENYRSALNDNHYINFTIKLNIYIKLVKIKKYDHILVYISIIILYE